MASMATPSATLGIDVSDRYSNYCSLDSAGMVLEEGRLRTSEADLAARFRDFQGRVIVEAGTHSPWISRLFADLGCEIVVANPRRVQLIAQSTRKNDRADAETLARLGRIDPKLLTPVTHRSAQAQADLASIRARNALVAARTVLINHVRGSVKSVGGRIPICDAHSFHRKARLHVPECLQVALDPLLNAIENLTEGIKRSDKLVLDTIQTRYPEARLLQQVAGVGPLISLTFILTIGDPARFKKSREIGPYLGLVPLQRDSGKSAPELRISKTGDSFLRQMLVNGAHYILGYRGPDCDMRRWGLERASGGKNAKKRAVIAVARRLAVLLHHLWVTGEVYQPLRGQVAA
jgi:transposase